MSEHQVPYPIPQGVHVISPDLLDLRSEEDVDHLILNPPPVTCEKNIWFFWDSGYLNIHPYAKRNIRAWHRRLAPLGWTVRVVDVEDSPRGKGHISNFLDTSDPKLFPRAYHENTIKYAWRGQTMSDLARFPLLLVHGGVYSDVGTMQIGDIEGMWNKLIANPDSPYEVMFHNLGSKDDVYIPFNCLMMARPQNALFQRANRLLLELWAENGGRTHPLGLIKHPLMKHAPQMAQPRGVQFEKMNRLGSFDATINELVDYGIQMVVMALVIGLIDVEDGWNGPDYAAKHVYPLCSAEHMMTCEIMTQFDGQRAFDLLSQHLPRDGEEESERQKEARLIVEHVLQRSFCVKLAHGPVAKVFGETLGLLWRKNEGTDNVTGTYAHWLRYAMIHWTQDSLPERLEYELRTPHKVGPLLRDENVLVKQVSGDGKENTVVATRELAAETI